MITAILVVGVAGVAGVLALFVAVAATRPSAYRVERELEVAAPADRVFRVFDDLRQFAGVLSLFGEPFEKRDPDRTTFQGPTAGVGQSVVWSEGKITVEQSVPGQKVGMKLDLVKPMKSVATVALTVAGTEAGSVVTWSMAGNHNFIGKAFGLFMNMDNMLGADIEKGLTQLKAVVEGKQGRRAA